MAPPRTIRKPTFLKYEFIPLTFTFQQQMFENDPCSSVALDALKQKKKANSFNLLHAPNKRVKPFTIHSDLVVFTCLYA